MNATATPPPTRYARSGNLSIAYHVLGEGPPDLVMTPGATSHLEFEYGWPALVQFYERLGSFARVIWFDKRGTGLSDRVAGIATLEERRTTYGRSWMQRAPSAQGSSASPRVER